MGVNVVADEPNKIVLLIAGNAGAGKSTFGDMLEEIFKRWCPTRQDSFAYTLKALAHQTTGAPWHLLNADKEVKESTNFEVAGEDTGVTIRKGLQQIGAWFRDGFSKKIWANSVRLRLQSAEERVTIVTDCRHPAEEIFWLRETCSSFAHVYVARIRNSRVPVLRGHPSEDLIADEHASSFDFLVDNEGTLEDLQVMANELATAIVTLVKTNKRRVKKSGDGWIVVGENGDLPYEPQLTRNDALTLACKLGTADIKQATYTHLKGSACS